MNPESADNSVQTLERKLNALKLRFSDLERRLKKIEQKVFPQPPSRAPKPRPREEAVRHTYLTKAIISARREYEQKSG